VTTSPAPLTVDVRDMDEDGQLDIVVVQAGDYGENGAISVLWNDGGGNLSDPVAVNAGDRPRFVAVADLDRNGRFDIFAYNEVPHGGVFVPNVGGRTFEPPVPLALGEQTSVCGLAAADFDLDGAEDVLFAGGETAHLFWNLGSSPREYDCDANGIPDACEGPIQDCDGDGIPDACDADSDRDGLPDPCEPPEFRRGDANADGKMDIADPLWILNLLFLEALDPSRLCLDAHDTNDDGAVEITDAVRLLDFLFLGSAAPPAPTGCGPDPEDGAHLGCARYPICL